MNDVKVDVELPKGAKARQVTLLTPDSEEAAVKASSDVVNGRLRFTVPQLKVYTLAVIELESA